MHLTPYEPPAGKGKSSPDVRQAQHLNREFRSGSARSKILGLSALRIGRLDAVRTCDLNVSKPMLEIKVPTNVVFDTIAQPYSPAPARPGRAVMEQGFAGGTER